MPTWFAAVIAVAAIAATYFCCVRPALRGRCAMTAATQGPDTEADRELAELREQVRVLRAQDALDSGRVPSHRLMPPADV